MWKKVNFMEYDNDKEYDIEYCYICGKPTSEFAETAYLCECEDEAKCTVLKSHK